MFLMYYLKLKSSPDLIKIKNSFFIKLFNKFNLKFQKINNFSIFINI
jgi:hypothetical protein